MGGRKFVSHLRDYCANCALAGVGYISNQKLHMLERLFWLFCVVLSGVGSYVLISEFQHEFESKAVSIVFESLSNNAKMTFPSIGICPMMEKNDISPEIEAYVRSLGMGIDDEYNYDVETHVAFIIYPYMYHEGTVKAYCIESESCEQCAKCPSTRYRDLFHRFGVNCSSYFKACQLNDRLFDCCQYFRLLLTPYGSCFMLNSLQNNRPGSGHWFNVPVESLMAKPELHLVTTLPMQVNVLNPEDIPHMILPSIMTSVTEPGQHKTFQVSVQRMVNDPDVREVSPQFRKCRFPDENLPNSVYQSYSFSTCIADCIRLHQVAICNCTMYTLMPYRHKEYRDCDLNGYLCLEAASMIKPDAKLLLPWAHSNYTCNCLPSCSEHDLKAVYESLSDFDESVTTRSITISVPEVPTELYRRQALRTRLDVVVTIGGVMGLFMGASILSAIELVYYFTLRIYNNYRNENPK